jgi:dephospho-CoA kinase
MLLVALTGNIAAGKSTVADSLQHFGAIIIDADTAARDAVRVGTPALRAIVERFGSAILLTDGSLDRAKLGAIVFADAAARQSLERIVHPAVQRAREEAVTRARTAGASIVICDIPLLFEAKLAWQFHRILCVDAPVHVRLDRLMLTRGMNATDAAARITAQMPAPLKRARSDLVLENARDLPALHAQIDAAWKRLQRWTPVARSIRAA